MIPHNRDTSRPFAAWDTNYCNPLTHPSPQRGEGFGERAKGEGGGEGVGNARQ